MGNTEINIEGREYLQERDLGGSSWTKTTLARRLDDDSRVVIKTVMKESVLAPLSRSYSARIAAALPPGVLPQYLNSEGPKAVGDSVVLEYVPGLTFNDYFAAFSRMKPRQAVELLTRWVREAVVRVGHLVDNGLIHGDIKPSNITLHGLIDLDVLSLADAPQNSVVYGTTRYMPPELFRNGKAAPASDFYSLGVTVLDMIGRRTCRIMPENNDDTYRAKAIGLEVVSDELLVRAGLGFPEEGRPEFMTLMRFVAETVKNNPDARIQTARAALQVLDDRGGVTEV